MSILTDAASLAAILTARGYAVEIERGDSTAGEPVVLSVTGRLDEGAPRTLWIDGAGTVRLQRVRFLSEESTRRVRRAGRPYRVTSETQQTINAWGKVTSVAELPAVLATLEELTLWDDTPSHEKRDDE